MTNSALTQPVESQLRHHCQNFLDPIHVSRYFLEFGSGNRRKIRLRLNNGDYSLYSNLLLPSQDSSNEIRAVGREIHHLSRLFIYIHLSVTTVLRHIKHKITTHLFATVLHPTHQVNVSFMSPAPRAVFPPCVRNTAAWYRN